MSGNLIEKNIGLCDTDIDILLKKVTIKYTFTTPFFLNSRKLMQNHENFFFHLLSLVKRIERYVKFRISIVRTGDFVLETQTITSI